MSKCHFVKVYFIGLLFCFLSAVVLFYTYTELQHGLHSDVLRIFQPVPFFLLVFLHLKTGKHYIGEKYASAQSQILI